MIKSDCVITDKYYSGPQRYKLFSDQILRKCFSVMVVFGITATIIRTLIFNNSYFYILLSCLCVLFPCAVQIAGGMSNRAWMWFAGFAGLTLFSFSLFMTRSTPAAFWLLLPAIGCLCGMHNNAPHLIKNWGFTEKTDPGREIFYIIVFCTLVAISYYSTLVLLDFKIGIASSAMAFVTVFIGALQYSLFTGLIYGVLVRHLYHQKVNVILVLAICAVMIQLLWVSGYFIGMPVLMVFAGNIVGVFFIQLTSLIAFSLCRSTRMVFAIHLTFFIVDRLRYISG